MQRLTEDRLKQEWSAFKADDQKRWNTYKLTNEEQWREHRREHKAIEEDLEALRAQMTDVKVNLESVVEGIDRRVKSFISVARDWAAELDES